MDGEGVLTDPEDKKRWWDRLPRTAAWADRYRGRFESVKKLIDDSIKAKKRVRLVAVLGVAGALVVSSLFVRQQLRQE